MKMWEQHLPIEYVLVMPDSGDDSDATFFQGWNPVIEQDGFVGLLHAIGSLPFHTSEIFMTHNQLLEFRRTGVERLVSAVGQRHLSSLAFLSPKSLTIYVCMPEEFGAVELNRKLSTGPSLILSLAAYDSTTINLKKKNPPACYLIDKQICSAVDGPHSQLRGPYDTSIEIPLDHGVTLPNVLGLLSLGYSPDAKREGVLDRDNDVVIQQIIQTAEVARKALVDRSDAGQQGLVVYCPSVKAAFYDFKSHMWNQLLRGTESKASKRFIENMFFRNKHYSRGETDGKQAAEFMSSSLGRYIGRMRAHELAATTASVALLSSCRQLPSVRLPNSLNLHGKELLLLESASKVAGVKGERILQERFANLVHNMMVEVGPAMQSFIERKAMSCTLCSDAPLEWLYFGNLPLMISHQVSRLPMTPGNLLLQFAAAGPRIVVSEEWVRDVLIIRSFADTDQIKPMLESAIQQFSLSERMQIRIVDVQSRADAVSALNSFKGGVVIFDCHGTHGGQDDVGCLLFGDEKVNTWELVFEARIPPVVLLSACLTSAVAGSHASVSSGLLRSGAVSVLGTYLPVSGAKSAAFIARILLRIDSLLPILNKFGFSAVSWRTFLAIFLRMSFTTDVLEYFSGLGLVDDATRLKINLDVNHRINLQDEDWYGTLIKNVATASGRSEAVLTKMVKEEHPFMETLNYSQTGTPERLYIKLLPSDSIVEANLDDSYLPAGNQKAL